MLELRYTILGVSGYTHTTPRIIGMVNVAGETPFSHRFAPQVLSGSTDESVEDESRGSTTWLGTAISITGPMTPIRPRWIGIRGPSLGGPSARRLSILTDDKVVMLFG